MITSTPANTHLDNHIRGIGDHQPAWESFDCPSCGSAPCGPHGKGLVCGGCAEGWPCPIVELVADELDRQATAIDTVSDPAAGAWLKAEAAGRRDVRHRILARVANLRGQILLSPQITGHDLLNGNPGPDAILSPMAASPAAQTSSTTPRAGTASLNGTSGWSPPTNSASPACEPAARPASSPATATGRAGGRARSDTDALGVRP